jgi:hypothetical protein
MHRLTWLLALLAVGCDGTPADRPPGPAAERSPAPGEVAVVEKVPAVPAEKGEAAGHVASASIADFSGIETWKGWFVEEWDGTNPAVVALEEHPKMGKSLRIESEGGKGDKSAVGKLLDGSYAGKEGFRVDFHNPQAGALKAAVGLFVSPQRIYYESPVITLPAGYSTHTIPLNRPVWKCRKTGWRHEAIPEGLDRVTQLDLLVYTSGKVGLFVPYVEAPEKAAPPTEEEKEVKRVGPARDKQVKKAEGEPGAEPEAEPGTEPDTGDILTPEEEKRLMERLSPEDREAIRDLLGTLAQ